ncbi:MAG: hypothetical protein E7661_04440 [Ruminococcaceae bacterium]|nr:hypothetical protein [Oscillospiraceae bacterium]
MNLFKKLLCGFLAGIMILGTCACGVSDENGKGDDTQGAATNAISEGESREPLEIPATRYDGTELVFLTRDESEWSTTSIFAEKDQISEDPISEAVYTRNDHILQNYGVTIKEQKEVTTSMPNIVQKEVSSKAGDFHAIVSNVSNSAGFSNNALVWNLKSERTADIDLSKSWWDQRLVEGFEINDMIFFATGDLLTLDNDATFVMMFNKTLAKESQIPDLYSMVSNYEWTFDKLFEYEQLVNDGDGVNDYDKGTCGFAMTNDVFYSMFYAGGLTVVTRNDDGTLEYGLNVERAQSVADKAKLIFSKDYIVNFNDVATSTGAGVFEIGKTCFGDNHALFLGEVLQCVERMRGFDVDFGVIPYPMYDTEQKAYYHMMHTTGSVVSIPRSIDSDIAMVASMIEAMAYYSVDTLTKQYYEINLTTKNVKDEQSGPMIDLILESRVCDLAYYYGWGNALATLTSALNPTSSASIASSSKSLSKAVTKQMERAIEKIEKNYSDS